MDLLKKVLSFILILQLLMVLTILTKHSLNKVDTITNHFNLLKVDQKLYQKDTTLTKNSKNREIAPSWQFKNNSPAIVKNIEYKAKKFLGKPYVWGATGPKCFDCSGFTQKVYKMVGINLPRVSRNQAKVGKLVRFNELKKGDMVFFDTSKTRVGRVNHVGIYLEDGKFIHASSGKHRVVITSFNKKRFYKSRFLWGRRVIKNKIAL